MDEKELLERIQKYHNDIVSKCQLAVKRQEDVKCNLPWEDMTDWHKGYMQALKDSDETIGKEKIAEE